TGRPPPVATHPHRAISFPGLSAAPCSKFLTYRPFLFLRQVLIVTISVNQFRVGNVYSGIPLSSVSVKFLLPRRVPCTNFGHPFRLGVFLVHGNDAQVGYPSVNNWCIGFFRWAWFLLKLLLAKNPSHHFSTQESKMAVADVFKTIKENDVKFVDLRFTDTRGKEQHVSVPAHVFGQDKFDDGHAFDGSSIAGWKGIQASDMLLMPDPDSARLDPFSDEVTLNITCDVIEPADGKGYDRDPRSIAKRAEAYLKSSGIGDVAYFGPEPEFFIFDGVTWNVDMSGCFVKISSEEAPWSTGKDFEGGNMGHRPPVKGGYFPVPPVDSLQDIRNAICLALEQQGVEVEVHHHEVAAPGQCEIGTKFNSLVKRADWLQILKYTVWNVSRSYGKTATFMPKPVVGDNGSGMHVHQSVWKGGQNLFSGDGYAGLSQFALHYIGGIIKHAKALNAIT